MGWTVLPDDKLYFMVMDKYDKLAIFIGKSTPKITYTIIQKFEVGVFLSIFCSPKWPVQKKI